MSSFYLCINENFDVPKHKHKTINLDIYYFRTRGYQSKPLGN